MAETSLMLHAGLDEGWDKVFGCVVEPDGKKRSERTFETDVAGLTALVEWLLGLVGGAVSRLAVTLERPGGPLAEMLLAHDVRFYTINPKQVDRFRDRHSVGGAKDDYFDAYVLADALRTDGHLFRQVEHEPALVVRLRELHRTREDLVTDANRWANRVRELWRQYYPQLLCLARDNLQDRFVWDLFERYPTPAEAATADEASIAELLRRHRVRRFSAPEVVAVLRATPLTLAEGMVETLAAQVRLALPMLQQAYAQLRESEQQLEATLQELEGELAAEAGGDDPGDVAIVRSMRGLGMLTCAGLFGEAYRFLQARDLAGLRNYCGCAAVTKASGRSRMVVMRRACNHHLRHSCDQWARASVKYDALARHHFRQLRARGHETARAYRSVTDRLLTILIAMLRDRTVYDAELPRRAQQLAA